MEFSGLNVFLIAFGTFLLGIFSSFISGSKALERKLSDYVKKSDCESQHRYDLATVEQIARLVSKIERNTRIQFKMLRAIVAYMELTPAQKAEILNTESGERDGDGN